MRLDLTLAHMGLGSRSTVGQWIRQGRVQVNGKTASDPGMHLDDRLSDDVVLDGQALVLRRYTHLMLHKPAGIITAMDDDKLPVVRSLLPEPFWHIGLFPVGRLDRDTTGLLILSNDGPLGHRLTSPRRGVWKVYQTKVAGKPFDAGDEILFASGLVLPDGLECLPARLRILAEYEAELAIHEGKFHQVKRMMEATGRQVTALHRTTFGPVQLDPALAAGNWRLLTDAEAASLYRAVNLDPWHE